MYVFLYFRGLVNPHYRAKSGKAYEPSPKLSFKIALLGNPDVGKTSLLMRFSNDIYKEFYRVTTGVDIKIKAVRLADEIIKLQVWDTAGMEKFGRLPQRYSEYFFCNGIL